MSDIVIIMMSNHFYFPISNDDEINFALSAMRILDFDLAYLDGISNMFYGLRHHGEGFTIEEYVAFGADIGDIEMQDLLPCFEVCGMGY